MPECTFAFPMGGVQITGAEKKQLYDLCKGSKIILEVGSWVGDSTSALGDYARDNDAVIYCVDWFKGNPGTDLIGKAHGNDIYRIFRDNMAELGLTKYINVLHMKSEDAVKIIADETFDFIFLDADHTYQPVKHDITEWMKKLKKGGIFAGHDYDSDEYEEEFIDKDFVHKKHNGLIKAVNEVLGAANIERGEGSLWWIKK